MVAHLVADGLSPSNGALFLVPTIIAGLIIPLVFAWSKRGNK